MFRFRSLFKIAFYLFFAWLFLVALWFGLPSPSVESQDPEYYPTTILKAGKTLTRVYEYEFMVEHLIRMCG
jgi:hypothetical protein